MLTWSIYNHVRLIVAKSIVFTTNARFLPGENKSIVRKEMKISVQRKVKMRKFCQHPDYILLELFLRFKYIHALPAA